MQPSLTANTRFWFFFVITLSAGVFLRLYGLGEQILLDDEWHGLYYVPGKTYSELLFRPAFGANSVPYNLYYLLLMNNYGLSELALRLPSVVFGIAGLLCLPLFVKKIVGERCAIYFAWLLSLSPFLIFYSRVSRPYEISLVLGFLAMCSLYSWLKTAKRIYATLYVLLCALVVFFHLSALPSVLTLVVAGFLLKLLLKDEVKASYSQLMWTNFILVTMMGAFLLPMLAHREWWDMVLTGKDRLNADSFFRFISILVGLSNRTLVGGMIFLALLGLMRLSKQYKALALLCLLMIVANLLGLAMTRQNGLSSGIVVARYAIILFPIYFLSVAYLLADALTHLESKKCVKRACVFKGLSIIALGLLFVMGPLPKVYAHTNNFTNHCAFQESYRAPDWSKSYQSDVNPLLRIKKENIPGYYHKIAKTREIESVIEYPMFLGDHYNLYYYYQHFHQKNVLIGYNSELPNVKQAPRDYIHGNLVVDHVMRRLSNVGNVKFKKLIDIQNIEALKKQSKSVLIMHKNLAQEVDAQDRGVSTWSRYIPMVSLLRQMESIFGEPIYSDQYVSVFDLSKRRTKRSYF